MLQYIDSLCKCNNFLSGSAVGRQHLLSKEFCFVYLKMRLYSYLQRCHSFLYRRTRLRFEAWTNTWPTWPSVRLDTQPSSFVNRHIPELLEKHFEKIKLHTILSFLFCRKLSRNILVSFTAMLVPGVHCLISTCLCVCDFLQTHTSFTHFCIHRSHIEGWSCIEIHSTTTRYLL